MTCPRTSCRHEPADWTELVEHQQLEGTPRAIIPKNNWIIRLGLIDCDIWMVHTWQQLAVMARALF